MKFKKPKFWDNKKISFWAIILFPFSVIYSILFSTSKFFQSFRNFNKVEIPIICVGNIYLGGTGKTPLAKEIFSIVKSLGKNPAFIKKKYHYLIDEIRMLEKTGKTFVSGDRVSGISQCSKSNFNVAILDDGFQDFSIKSNFSILCFNSKQSFGNGLVIPSGPLREPSSAISRADCIIINGLKNLELEDKLKRNFKQKKLPIFYSKYVIKNLENYKNKKILAFAGVGNPSNFFDLLKENNLDVRKTYSFPDHHNYTQKDLNKIKEDKSMTLVTTEKDYYRMSKEEKEDFEYIEVSLEIENENTFKNLLKEYL